MAEDGVDPGIESLEGRVIARFRSAYPDVPDERLEHMARNFTQVLNGIIDIGEKLAETTEYSHMDVANGLVYSCIANTYLEELHEGEWDPRLDDPSTSRISDGEMKRLLGECAARVADWMLGMEILRDDPELLAKFVVGAVVLGAKDFDRNRGNLSY